MKYVAIASLMFAMLAGCGPVKKQPTTKQEQTIAGGYGKIEVGHKGFVDYVQKLRGTPLTERQTDYTDGISANGDLMYAGGIEMKKPCDDAVKKNETSRQGFYKSLDWGAFVGGVTLAIGIALVVMGVVNGQKLGLGVGVAVLGGSLVAVFLTIRSAAPVLPWVMAGVGALAVLGFGVLVFDRIRAKREKDRRERQLAAEQKATKELVATVDEAAQRVPEDQKPDLFNKIREIQSPTTEALVKAAKNGTAVAAAAATDVRDAAVATVAAAQNTVDAADAAAPIP